MAYTKHRSPALSIMQLRTAALVALCENALAIRLDSIAACTTEAEIVKALIKAVITHDLTLLRIVSDDIAADILELPYIMIHFHEDCWDEGVWHRDNNDRNSKMHWLPLRASGAAISFLPDAPLDLTRVVARVMRFVGIKQVATPRLEANEYLVWPSTTFHRGMLNRGTSTRINYIVTVRTGADSAAVASQMEEFDDATVIDYCRTAHAAILAIAAGSGFDAGALDARYTQLFRTSLHALTLKEDHLRTNAFSAAMQGVLNRATELEAHR
jgi:hypothetical protein